MSIDLQWNRIDEYRYKQTLSHQDVINLEHIFQNILKYHQSNECHEKAGYSKSFPRYLEKMSDTRNKNILDQLTQHLHAREYQLDKLRNIIYERRKIIQRECTHEWEYDTTERDERSRHICHKCDAFR